MPPGSDIPAKFDYECFTCRLLDFKAKFAEMKQTYVAGSYPFRRSYEWGYNRNKKQFAVFSSSKAFLSHHLDKHGLDEPIRIRCTQCSSFFCQPEDADLHRRMSMKAIQNGQYICGICPSALFPSAKKLVDHAYNTHNVHFDECGWMVKEGDAYRLDCWEMEKLKTNINLNIENVGFMAFTCAIYSFGTISGADTALVKPGCVCMPPVPYRIQYACGLCKYSSSHKKRVRQHLRMKHNITDYSGRVKVEEVDEDKREEIQLRNELGLDTLPQDEGLSADSDSDTSSGDRYHRSRSGLLKLRKGNVGSRGPKLYNCTKQYVCKTCAKLFDSPYAAYQHEDRAHPFLSKQEEMFPCEAVDLCCSFCSERFGSVNATQQHEKRKHPEMVELCRSTEILSVH